MTGFLKVMKVLLIWFARSASASPVEPPKKETPKPQVKTELDFKNNSERLKKEWNLLFQKNEHLWDLIIDAHVYCYQQFGKYIVVTMIDRTQAEQDEIYKDDPKYNEKPYKSPHQFFHAVDLRSSTFETHEIEQLVNYLNTKYNSTNYYKWTAKCHAVINGAEHFHIQFVRKV